MVDYHKKMKTLENYAQKGQIQLHKFRMLGQVIRKTILGSFLAGCIAFGVCIWRNPGVLLPSFSLIAAHLTTSFHVPNQKSIKHFGKVYILLLLLF